VERRIVISMLAASLLAAGCGGSDSGGSSQTVATPSPTAVDPAHIRPSDFVAAVDNPLFPLVPGTRFRYKGTTDEGPETDITEVTRQTKRILGVPAVVVRDRVTRDGELVEDTLDWYAQDRAGNVWYLGEDTKEYENGKVVSTAGSWQAGVRGAQPGIVMEAQPRVGDSYRQEFDKGEAEDMADVLSVSERAKVPFGTFGQLLLTKEYTPLEPDIVEHKYYARGVGFVLEVTVKGGSDRLELVDVTKF
jgi:hypothetical protein